jgi:hypothetical protein
MVFVVISPLALLILLIWVFSLLILVRFARRLSILFIFSKKQLFVSLILCMVFFGFYFVDFSSYFYYFSPILGFACSCFSSSLRCIVRALIWDLSVFLIYALMAINFPLRTAFAVSHGFW